MKRQAMLDMKVAQLTVDPFTNMPLLILKDERGGEALPIWIGLIEASAIATELEKISLDRPMTHDLMKSIIGKSGLKVDRVEVHDVRDNTFYATIFLKRARASKNGGEMAIDSRPSDAIALALRTGARICVARKVLEQTRFIDLEKRAAAAAAKKTAAKASGKIRKRAQAILGFPADDLPRAAGGGVPREAANERLRELLESLSDEEFGKWKM